MDSPGQWPASSLSASLCLSLSSRDVVSDINGVAGSFFYGWRSASQSFFISQYSHLKRCSGQQIPTNTHQSLLNIHCTVPRLRGMTVCIVVQVHSRRVARQDSLRLQIPRESGQGIHGVSSAASHP